MHFPQKLDSPRPDCHLNITYFVIYFNRNYDVDSFDQFEGGVNEGFV